MIALVTLAIGRLQVQSGSYPVPKFSEIENTEERKRIFFTFFAKIVHEINAEILEIRNNLASINEDWQENHSLGWRHKSALRKIAVKYRVLSSSQQFSDIPPEDIPKILHTLLRRVDIVPAAIALVQAAKESGWGTSRFATEGNNFYGQRCFQADCGLVPENRLEGKRFEVKVFSHPKESVESYVHNLNTHWAYRNFRDVREEARLKKKSLSEKDLVIHLRSYSERGDKYISDLLLMISRNEKLLGNIL